MEKRKALKNCLIQALGSKCQICDYAGESLAFDFHHIDASKKVYKIADVIASFQTRALYTEINNLALLCTFCHQKLEKEKMNYHFKVYENNQAFFAYLATSKGFKL